jgi:hypothetical protein
MRERVRGLRVDLASSIKRLNMPAWLEILLNLSGYVGFVALATHGTSCRHPNADDQTL